MSTLAETRTSGVETVLEALDAAVVIVTDGFVVRSWNRAAERIFGWTAGETVGRSLLKVLPPGRYVDGWSDQAAFNHIVRHDVWRGEAEFERRDGSPFFAEVTYGMVRDDAGRPDAYFGVYRNITGYRELESTLDDLVEGR